ncbi:hypothetical protein [Hymenobacter psychrotolerans]|nr:hypothetical protein [Hymenobacter psychrotolerans]
MEPNQAATPGTTMGGTTPGQSQNSSQPDTGTKQTTQSSSSAGSSSQKQQPADSKNQTESAGLQQLLDQLPQGVRDFCTSSWSQIGKMSTTQKVAGAAALAGLGYLALRSGKSASPKVYDKPYRGSGKGYQSTSPADSRAGYSGGLDRQNESRAGGSYQAGSHQNSAGSSSASSSGSANKSSMANRNSGSAYDEAGSGFGGDI